MPKPASPEIAVPSPHNWRTTDEDEINRRRARARTEEFRISNTDPRHPIFSNFRVQSGSGLTYSVEIRDVRQRQFACDCVDFRINGLGTCKHVEAVLLQLAGALQAAVPGGGSERLAAAGGRARPGERLDPAAQRRRRACRGRCGRGSTRTALCARARRRRPSRRSSSLTPARLPATAPLAGTRPWLEGRRRAAERKQLRREYELKVQSGEWPAHETKVPLFPYQREGMLHLAFTERALLADEMGLGKTIQAIAACALLHRLGQAAPRAGRHARLAEDRVGGADSAVHRPALPARLRRQAARRLEAYDAARRRHARSSPSSITSRCSPTRWT